MNTTTDSTTPANPALAINIPLLKAVEKLLARTPEQVEADRLELLASARPGRSLPEGKSLNDVIEGTWPGDESDEEIRILLNELS